MDQGVLHSRSAQPIVATTALNWPVLVLTPPCHLFDEQPTSVNLPESWSQLIRDRVIDEDEEKLSMKQMEIKKQLLNQHTYGICGAEIKVKQENTLSLDLQSSKKWNRMHPNSVKFESHTKDIGTVKKPKVEVNTSGHGAFKVQVRKEKLGDRITTLHQLVSPFGKTDTASVLLEAIGYIKLLQSQIQVLSLPYMGNRRVKISSSHQVEEFAGDLRSRGLCLVPVSGSLLSVAEVHGSDYHFH